MSSVLKTSPLSYRILIEKIDGDGNKTVIDDTGFIHMSDEAKQVLSLLLQMFERDSEFRDKIMKIKGGLNINGNY